MARDICTNVEGKWFTPSSEDGEDDPVGFYIKPLPGNIMRKLLGDEMRQDGGGLSDENLVLALTRGVTDWKNFSINGNPKFSVNKLLMHLDADDQIELASEIVNFSRMNEESEKN